MEKMLFKLNYLKCPENDFLFSFTTQPSEMIVGTKNRDNFWNTMVIFENFENPSCQK